MRHVQLFSFTVAWTAGRCAVSNNCPGYNSVTVYSFCAVLWQVLSSRVLSLKKEGSKYIQWPRYPIDYLAVASFITKHLGDWTYTKSSLYSPCMLTCLVDFATDMLSYGGALVEGNTASVVRRSRRLALAMRRKPVIQKCINRLEQYIERYQKEFSKLIINALSSR
jgi:hypothetical protein